MRYYKFYPDEDNRIDSIIRFMIFASKIVSLKDENEGKISEIDKALVSHRKELESQAQRRAVACFVRGDYNGILQEERMWNEYANCHKGFCIEYNNGILEGMSPLRDNTPADQLENVYYDVEYGKGLIVIDRIDPSNEMTNTLGHKLDKYENEHETRLIFRFPPIKDYEAVRDYNSQELIGELIPIKMREKAICAIYLGKFASADKLKKLIDFAREYNIPCYQILV